MPVIPFGHLLINKTIYFRIILYFIYNDYSDCLLSKRIFKDKTIDIQEKYYNTVKIRMKVHILHSFFNMFSRLFRSKDESNVSRNILRLKFHSF